MLSFKHIRPPNSRDFPVWDLSVIFEFCQNIHLIPRFMRKSPFSLSPGRQPFLVLLAAGARRGESMLFLTWSFSYGMDFHPCDAVTFWKVLYINSDQSGSRPGSFAFFHFRKNCLEDYFRRVDPSGRGISLYPSSLSYSSLGRRATFIRTLSGWFSHLISYCYNQPGKKVLGLSGARAHEFRAFASP